MLFRLSKELTSISDDSVVNKENYFEAFSYIERLYSLINSIKMIVPISEVHLKPSFKGKYVCEKFNIPSNIEENEMRLFYIELDNPIEDGQKENIEKTFSTKCDEININTTEIKLLFKED